MIQKGIIAQVIDKYTYKVRIPKYDKLEYATNSTKLEDLSSGIVCTIPGIDISYALGDVVLVSFENDEISKPIILGLLYRENKSDADISVSNVDSSLTEIQDSLNKIHSSNLYTHIKYSNDNGLTFTSLFSPLYHESIIDGEVVCQPLFDTDENINGIKIDKRTRNINWSIIDADNNDVTRNISIETTIFDSNGNIIKKTNKNDGEYNITINNSSQIDGDLYLTYKLFITKEYLDTLHVLLATDREPIGATPGDYIGLSLSTSSIPSINPSDYSWLSFSALNSNINIDINNKIAKLSAELNAKLEELTDVVYYKEVTWTQAEVNEYCQTGYQGIWERDLENGYIGEIKEGSIFYISVYNTGDNISSPEDDSYGRLTLKALMDAGETDDVLGVVIEYLVSGEVAINALARFKSDLLAPNDQTLIYGGHITTGHIQDYTGKNFIQLTDESGRGKAGHLEFKNADTWEASTSGLQWNTYYEPAEEIPENLKGTLSVKGDVYANSLTIIGAGGNTYSGTAAINISGYSIEIEKDATDVEEDVSVYLYPILYHNGIKLDEYGLSDDKVVDTSKTYYTRSGEPGSYTYAEVQNPIGNPHNNNYYEKQIDYTHFVWYEDDITPGTTGDPDRGKILAFYGHVYKVTYDFDDGAVGGGTEIQTREVDPSKYITKTGDTSITVHPETWQNQASYISLTNTGLDIFNSNNESIAQYGSSIRIGRSNANHLEIDNNGINILNNTLSLANFGSVTRIGDVLNNNVLIDNDSIDIRDGATVMATFSASGAIVGENASGKSRTEISTAGMQIYQNVNGTDTLIANLGYGSGNNSGGGTSNAPYYSLGPRTGTVGNYSVAEGYNSKASAYCSHAEGLYTVASGRYSHAEGRGTDATGGDSHAEGNDSTASGAASHAEGYLTVASGNYSHAEGHYTIAAGNWSHAQGHATRASSDHQTAIGRWNIDDSADTYLLIIGNGTSSSAKSNALTVDWSGNVSISGTLTQSSDRRLKEHISYLDKDAVNFIQALKPAYFRKNEQPHLGFYAQDVEQSDKWHCMVGEMNGFKTLGYTEIIAPLVKYCQKLEERITTLEQEVNQ